MKIKGVQKAIDKIRGKDKKNSMFDPVHYVIGMLKLYGIIQSILIIISLK